MLILRQKIFLILYPSFENSTTRIAITHHTLWSCIALNWIHIWLIENANPTLFLQMFPLIRERNIFVSELFHFSRFEVIFIAIWDLLKIFVRFFLGKSAWPLAQYYEFFFKDARTRYKYRVKLCKSELCQNIEKQDSKYILKFSFTILWQKSL